MTSATYYVDASIIAALALGDIAGSSFEGAIGDHAVLAFSPFGLGEAVSAISARGRRAGEGDTAVDSRIVALRAFLDTWKEIEFASADVDRAILLCGRASLALKFADAIHVATAERLGLPLLTADRQQSRAATAITLPTTFITLDKG